MERQTIQVGTFEVNCSVLAVDGRAWIIDPGMEAGRIAALVEKMRLAPGAVLLTHGHFDHIGAIADLQEKWPSLPVYVHPADEAVLDHPLNKFLPEYPPMARPRNLRDARELARPGFCEVVFTPGHTPGGVCYHFTADGLLFSGDTLFAGSIGRTDLPGGDMRTLMQSLESLKALPDDTAVVPGHGPSTTIGREKAGNPFLTAG